MGKTLKAYSDPDLDPMMLNIEIVRVIFIYYNVYFNFMFLDRFLSELSCKHTSAHEDDVLKIL